MTSATFPSDSGSYIIKRGSVRVLAHPLDLHFLMVNTGRAGDLIPFDQVEAVVEGSW